ncbi:hypothetical protein NliqN6_3460 [Naganishia liquefaciens]|uniref:Aminotransferase class I/classII large domain-containing protein n=1 Tax=Naganishia liquefaciens TaxID=104408 RepID=A0A8H3TTY3_9TREE|nr:hypothetical protein NliqN6_3460 [Naganishia liquefaciens]
MPRFPLSRNVAASIAPPIPKAQAWAASYRATADKPLLNLSQGVPGDPPHEILRDALVKCTADPKSAGYGPILGEPELRRAVAREMAYVYRFDRQASGTKVLSEPDVGEEGTDAPANGAREDTGPPGWEEVAITAGCNQAFFDVMLALCESGDKVIVPVPWYFNMLMTFQILNLTPLPLPLASDSSFLPSVSAARALLDSPQGKNTKAIVLVTPNNPTGATYPPALIDEFADLARERQVALIVDETYRDFLLPDRDDGDGDGIPDSPPGRPHTLFERRDWRDHVISLSSFSKSYKIPGHRLGMIVAGREVLQAVTKVADSIQICAPRPPQLALTTTLPLLRADLSATSSRIHARLALFESLISRVRGWRVISRGGFYAYVQHPYLAGPSSTSNNAADPAHAPEPGLPVPSERVAELLATRCGILTLPGAFFMPLRIAPEWRALADAGSALVEDKWIRFAIANVSDDVVRGVPERLEMLNEIMEREYGCQVVE